MALGVSHLTPAGVTLTPHKPQQHSRGVCHSPASTVQLGVQRLSSKPSTPLCDLEQLSSFLGLGFAIYQLGERIYDFQGLFLLSFVMITEQEQDKGVKMSLTSLH